MLNFSDMQRERRGTEVGRVKNEDWDLICSSACNDFMCFSGVHRELQFSALKLIKVFRTPGRVRGKSFKSPLNTFRRKFASHCREREKSRRRRRSGEEKCFPVRCNIDIINPSTSSTEQLSARQPQRHVMSHLSQLSSTN